jgi:hypothetical protein
MRPVLTVIDRIDAKLDKSAGPDGCWMWLGACGQKGQPRTSIKKRAANPRRLLWAHVHGEEVPTNRQVATTCKAPACLNPTHLYLRPWMDHETRFWQKVDKSAGPDACWVWTSTKFSSGYGAFKVDDLERQSHRVSYEYAHGVSLLGRDADHILHSCDNPPCVNPAHLRLGTNADNIADCIAKGRNSRGEKHGEAVKAARAKRSA